MFLINLNAIPKHYKYTIPLNKYKCCYFYFNIPTIINRNKYNGYCSNYQCATIQST